jgi:hypothetical protein
LRASRIFLGMGICVLGFGFHFVLSQFALILLLIAGGGGVASLTLAFFVTRFSLLLCSNTVLFCWNDKQSYGE